jgi:hypothetical protein
VLNFELGVQVTDMLKIMWKELLNKNYFVYICVCVYLFIYLINYYGIQEVEEIEKRKNTQVFHDSSTTTMPVLICFLLRVSLVCNSRQIS